MKMKKLYFTALGLSVLFFGGTHADAQVVDAVKDAASKTKDVTVSTAKKTTVVVTDGVKTGAEMTKDATVDGTKKAAKTTKTFGNRAVDVTENVAEQSYQGGKWATVKTWDGTKWVSNRVWFASKKTAGATKDVIVGDGNQNQ